MIFVSSWQQPIPEGLGVVTRPLSPEIDVAFVAAQAALSTSDPKSTETFQYLRRIIGAPILAPKPGAAAPSKSAHLSDLNPVLKKAAWGLENPLAVGAIVVGIPVLAFVLGRASRRR